MKPNWKKAPSWAKWLAMDWDGTWQWFEHKPTFDGEFWRRAERPEYTRYSRIDHTKAAKESLEKKP